MSPHMPTNNVELRPLMVSGTATVTFAPAPFESSNDVEVNEIVGSPILAQFAGKTLRVVDGNLFVIDPGSPPTRTP